jgi:hypothetical protein
MNCYILSRPCHRVLQSKPYFATELDLAPYLVASVHRALDPQPQRALVQFVFDSGVAGSARRRRVGSGACHL